MKKIIGAIFFAFLCSTAFAQKESDFQTVLNNEKVGITGYSGAETNISVPKKIMGADVAIIEPGAFAHKQLTRVKLSDGITNIGKQAFMNNGLSEITIPKTVFLIGEEAFAHNSITTITINKDNITLDAKAFAGNPITKIVIGKEAAFDNTAFTPEFRQAYYANTRQAGTYTLVGGKWNYKN